MELEIVATTSPERPAHHGMLGAWLAPDAQPARLAVGPMNRNGYATTLGQLFDLIARAGVGVRRARTARISKAAEDLLRDGDASQLGAVGVILARSGNTAEWRAFLERHFRERYDLMLVLGASETSVR